MLKDKWLASVPTLSIPMKTASQQKLFPKYFVLCYLLLQKGLLSISLPLARRNLKLYHVGWGDSEGCDS